MPTAPHEFTLDAAARTGGIVAAGRATQIVEHLNAGRPLRIAVLGASVAINGGCTHQPTAACADFSGQRHVRMAPWRSSAAPHKGFFVRWLDWINASWPHDEHRLHNNAIGASNIGAWLPCLFAHLPPLLDLVVLELGSMAHWQRLPWIETLARKLRSMRPSPVVLFLTVPLWHDLPARTDWQRTRCAVVNGTRMAKKMDRQLRQQTGAAHARESWALVERQIDRVCEHYGEACLSMRRALGPGARAERAGFSLGEIAADCLHPNTGSLGTE